MSLADYARETIGTPFKHQGRICGTGLDCAGVIVHIAKRAGLVFFDNPSYPRTPYKDLLGKTLESQPCLERIFELEPSCVLLMRFAKEPMHLAFYTGDSIIHAYESAGRCVEHLLDNVWKKRIVKMYRMKM